MPNRSAIVLKNKSQLNLPNPASWIGQGKYPWIAVQADLPLPQLLMKMLLHSRSLQYDVRDCRCIERSINIPFDIFEFQNESLW